MAQPPRPPFQMINRNETNSQCRQNWMEWILQSIKFGKLKEKHKKIEHETVQTPQNTLKQTVKKKCSTYNLVNQYYCSGTFNPYLKKTSLVTNCVLCAVVYRIVFYCTYDSVWYGIMWGTMHHVWGRNGSQVDSEGFYAFKLQCGK